MRITAEEKTATRRRILDAAIRSFRTCGYESTITRDIAVAADIATGTLFNYFPTKEAIVESLAVEAVAKARSRFNAEALEGDLEESLFAYVVAELRQLKPLRKFITPFLETSLNPLSAIQHKDGNTALRVEHMETITQLACKHGGLEFSPVALQVYWTLYIGVLAFWSNDKSPKQEDTLALLDQSLTMFVSWLRSEPGRSS